ncbi:unnamed protein product [Effrenium voratum]|nr:unnamed protein product [Effrenium voratum]
MDAVLAIPGLWLCLGTDTAALSACNRRCSWCHLCRQPLANLVATIERPGEAAGRKVSEELTSLQCAVQEQMPGRVYFQASERELLRAAHVEQVAVVVLRHRADPVGTFLSFPGASAELCLQRIVSAVMGGRWPKALLFWCSLLGRPPPHSFRVKAKRSTKAGKALVSSDAIAEEVGGALMERFGWRVDLTSPDLEVRVQLNQEELLISLTALVQPLGARGCYLSHPGLHPAVAWVLARCLDIQDQEVVLDPMCGKGVLLCEAAMNWPRAGAFLGCDLDVAQLRKAVDNLRSAARSVQLCRADAAVKLPLAEQSVDKILTDLPFGRQFGSVEENQRLYPRVLAEMRRVIRPQGLAAVLTSSANKDHMRAAASLAAGWAVEHQRSFRLFAKTDACIYLLRPVGPVGPVGAGGARPAPRKAKGGAFGWEDGSSWHAQWARARPALVLFGEKETTGGSFISVGWDLEGSSLNHRLGVWFA